MRLEPSTTNHQQGRGGEFGSPHISRMEGDLNKIQALGHEDRLDLSYGQQQQKQQQQQTFLKSSSWSEEVTPSRPSGNINSANNDDVGGEFPQSHETERTSWSNVVKSAGTTTSTHSSPASLIKLSPSTETFHASNVTTNTTTSSSTTNQAPTTFDYLSSQRSHSFDDSRCDKSTSGFYKSYSFGANEISSDNSSLQNRNESNNAWGNHHQQQQHQQQLHLAPSPSFKDPVMMGPSQTLPTIQQGMERPSTPLHSPMLYPTPYHNHPQGMMFSPRDQFKQQLHPQSLTYSPLSLGESVNTDQTSPMSSPASSSPHMTPLLLPRSKNNQASLSPGPTMWQLNDVPEFHSESPIPHPYLHPQGDSGGGMHQPPQSVHHQPPHSYVMNSPYHQQHHHRQQQQGSPNEHQHHPHVGMIPRQYAANAGPGSPSQRPHTSPGPSSHHHQPHSMQIRRPGGKPSATGTTGQSSMSRSSTEILKTLLRKKACLYEPDTSHAISLVTWLVGRRLALSQGYFTRQQLQLGVHSCVASKIDQGHVTRTKVNRCMQIILNSCFHYIIPRPDGSEESGEHFREVFTEDVIPEEEHLLKTLPMPWNDLQLVEMEDCHDDSPLFYGSDDDGGGDQNASGNKSPNKESSGASVDSGGKRAVLLCFNENVRSASDVFRCHNEFIRDVAHTANLNLSPDEWRSFYTGTKVYRRRSAATDNVAEISDRMDQQGLSRFRTSWCAKRYEHDQTLCSFAHVDVNRGWLRRDPFRHNYKPTMCPNIIPNPDAQDCYFNMCPHGVDCNHAHSKEEVLYHPENYKRHQCRSHSASCPLRDICPNVHTNKASGSSSESYQVHGYHRHGKRHGTDHSPIHRGINPSSKRRHANTPGHLSGFPKHPGGSPMLYINPAPESDFEKTLLLPGLQALFRDHSTSTFSVSTKDNAHCEFGTFGCRFVPHVVDDGPKLAPIGSPSGYKKK